MPDANTSRMPLPSQMLRRETKSIANSGNVVLGFGAAAEPLAVMAEATGEVVIGSAVIAVGAGEAERSVLVSMAELGLSTTIAVDALAEVVPDFAAIACLHSSSVV